MVVSTAWPDHGAGTTPLGSTKSHLVVADAMRHEGMHRRFRTQAH